MKSLLLETFTKEELEQQKLPKTWEEYCDNHYRIGYYLDCGSRISSFIGSTHNEKLKPKQDQNTLESKENAEAILALCQLIRLRDEYNRHKPINYKNDSHVHAVVYDPEVAYYKAVLANRYSSYKHLFTFHNKELAQEFIRNFKPLLDIFYKIMY
jgi:hypothetical protein